MAEPVNDSDYPTHPPRTLTQNAALHKGFGLIAEQFDARGIDFKQYLEVVEKRLDVPVTPYIVKEYMYRPVMKAMTGNESTTEQDTVEPSAVWEAMMKFLCETFEIEYVEFPSRFNR